MAICVLVLASDQSLQNSSCLCVCGCGGDCNYTHSVLCTVYELCCMYHSSTMLHTSPHDQPNPCAACGYKLPPPGYTSKIMRLHFIIYNVISCLLMDGRAIYLFIYFVRLVSFATTNILTSFSCVLFTIVSCAVFAVLCAYMCCEYTCTNSDAFNY